MDSFGESSSSRSLYKLHTDDENNRKRHTAPRERGAHDVVGNVFTSMSEQNDGSVPAENGPRVRVANNTAISEPGTSRSTMPVDANSERARNTACSHIQNPTCKQITSFSDTTPSSSKSESSNFENGREQPNELPTCQRHKGCIEKVTNGPSTSSSKCDTVENCKESRKRPSSLKLNQSNLDNDSSSDTGNDDYSLGSEDGCIYTYRGGEHLADLPSSFFSLDMGLPLDRHLPIPPNYQVPAAANERNSRASSPDMDFLEMDFDPGPSCEVDTGDESTPNADIEVAENLPEEEEPVLRATPEVLSAQYQEPSVSNVDHCDAPSTSNTFSIASTSQDLDGSRNNNLSANHTTHTKHVYYGPHIIHVNTRGEHILVRRTMSHNNSTPVQLHVSSGDLVSPREMLNYEEDSVERLAHQINQGHGFDSANLSCAFYHLLMAKKLMGEKTKSDSESSCAANAGDTQSSTSPCPAPNLPEPAVDSKSQAAIHTTASNASGSALNTPDNVELQVPSSSDSSNGMDISNNSATCSEQAAIPNAHKQSSSTVNAVGSISSSSCAGLVEPPRCMVWSEREACERQVTQIGTSACGATAVINVFVALGVPVNLEKINSSVGTRQRANNAPLFRYILSRAIAGCTAADLVNGIQRASDGLVTARFFPTYPERAFSLSHWLADWISLGAVPVLTLNLQAGCEGEIPDAWHHQMVFGVSSRGIYLCNPVECVRETALWPRLTSPSVLLVRARDVLSRFTPDTDLTGLMFVPDRRFHSFNVLGQVVNVIREWRATRTQSGPAGAPRTRHIRVPAAYQAGVTVAALTGSEAHRRIMHAPQLPILAPQTDP